MASLVRAACDMVGADTVFVHCRVAGVIAIGVEPDIETTVCELEVPDKSPPAVKEPDDIVCHDIAEPDQYRYPSANGVIEWPSIPITVCELEVPDKSPPAVKDPVGALLNDSWLVECV